MPVFLLSLALIQVTVLCHRLLQVIIGEKIVQMLFYPAAYNLAGSNTGFNMQTQDRYLLNMSYFRIKNITLGYTLPAVWTKKVLINKARIYVACENFFTFDKLGGLPIDAEEISGFSMFNSTNYNSGRTGVGTPTMKNMSVGIQLNF